MGRPSGVKGCGTGATVVARAWRGYADGSRGGRSFGCQPDVVIRFRNASCAIPSMEPPERVGGVAPQLHPCGQSAVGGGAVDRPSSACAGDRSWLGDEPASDFQHRQQRACPSERVSCDAGNGASSSGGATRVADAALGCAGHVCGGGGATARDGVSVLDVAQGRFGAVLWVV